TPVGTPQFLDLQLPLLLALQAEGPGEQGVLTVRALDADTGETRWHKELSLAWPEAFSGRKDGSTSSCDRLVPPPEWPLAVDLDGSGTPQVVVPVGEPGSGVRLGVEVLEAATGRTLWRRSFGATDVDVAAGYLENAVFKLEVADSPAGPQ